MLIQILLSLFIFFALIKVLGRFRAKELSARVLVFWLIFWLVVGVVVWQPRLASEAANRVGVGRGADLVLYVSIAVLFYLIFRVLVKMEKIEKNITKIVRELTFRTQNSNVKTQNHNSKP